MKKSRSETADTRRRILSTASRLFLENGLADTGIASVMAAAGLTQGAFYRHFTSKDQLIAEANLVATEEMFARYSSAVRARAPIDAVRTIVDMYLGQAQPHSADVLCPLPNLGSELRRGDDTVRHAALDGYARVVELIRSLTRKLALQDDVAETIVAALVGAVMLSRLAKEETAAQAILDSARVGIDVLLQGGKTARRPGKATSILPRIT